MRNMHETLYRPNDLVWPVDEEARDQLDAPLRVLKDSGWWVTLADVDGDTHEYRWSELTEAEFSLFFWQIRAESIQYWREVHQQYNLPPVSMRVWPS